MGGVSIARKTTINAKAQEQSSTGVGGCRLSFSLASAASAAPAANIPTRSADLSHEFILGEEEISDVSLATFYVFDKENSETFRPGVQLVRGGGCGGGGCGGCGGGGCKGCGGGGGCGDVEAAVVEAALGLDSAQALEAAQAMDLAAAPAA